MGPDLVGKRVEVSPMKFEDVKIGDLVLVNNGSNLYLHQLLVKSSDWGVTWGWNNDFFDPKFNRANFYGGVNLSSWRKLALIYFYEWSLIKEKLNNNNIKWLILKGPFWQKINFGYFFNKPFCDWDVLIEASRFYQTKKIMESEGWNEKTNEQEIKGDQENIEIVFHKIIEDGVELKIDLHLKAVGLPSAPGKLFQWPYSKGRVTKLSQALLEEYRVNNSLPPTEWLFYASLHYFWNHNCRGIWHLADMANIILNNNIDWERLFELADKYSQRPIIELVIYWVNRMFVLEFDFATAPGNTLTKLLVNEKTFFKVSTISEEKRKHVGQSILLRFSLWPTSRFNKFKTIAKYFLSLRFIKKLPIYLKGLPSLQVLVHKTYQWLYGHLLQPFLSLLRKN